MAVHTITLQAAYMIENLRKHGVSNKELIEINDQSIERWNDLKLDFDFNVLKELAETDQDAYSTIVRDGYQVKFLTINGLINLIQLKFDKKRDADFTVHEDGISNLELDENQYSKLRQFLSQNWKVIEIDNRLAIRSVHS